MIKVTVELYPFGKEEGKKTLAEAIVWNTGIGSPFLGEYGYELYDAGGKPMRRGFIGEFFRKQYTVWWLLAAVLKEAFPDVTKTFRDGTIKHSEKVHTLDKVQ